MQFGVINTDATNLCMWKCNDFDFANECTVASCDDYNPQNCPKYASQAFDTMYDCIAFQKKETTKSLICLYYCSDDDWPNVCNQPGEICPDYNADGGCPIYTTKLFNNHSECLHNQKDFLLQYVI